MVALYDLTMAAISLIACCLPAVLMALIIEAILDRTDKSSITIFTAIAIAFSLCICHLVLDVSIFHYFFTALISGSLSILILRNKYNKFPAVHNQILSNIETDSKSSNQIVSDFSSDPNPDEPSSSSSGGSITEKTVLPERAEFNSVVKHSTAIYKIIIAILSICLFIVIVYVLYQSENIDLVTAILSMSLTSVIYLFVPIILIVIGKKFSNAKLILVSIANGTIIWILFYFCSLLYAGMPNSAATFIWSVVGYLLMRWKILSSKASKPSAPSIKRLQVLSLVLAIIVSCLFWVIAFFSVAYYVSEREEMGTFTTTYKPEKRRLMGKKEFKRIMDHLHNTPKTSDFID